MTQASRILPKAASEERVENTLFAGYVELR